MNRQTTSTFFICFLIALGSLISCTTVLKVKDGDTAYERKQYAIAITLLKSEYDKANSENVRAHKAFYLGQSYKRLSEYSEARDWYATAIDHDYGYEALMQYGILSRQLGEFAEAEKAMDYLDKLNRGDPRIHREIANLKLLQAWETEEFYRGVKIESTEMNSNASDYYPREFQNGKLLFISDRTMTEKEGTYKWTGRKYSSLYIYDIDNKTVKPYKDIPTNTLNDGMLARSISGDVVVFTSCTEDESEPQKDAFCQLYYIKNAGTFYAESTKMPFVQEGYNYMHPALNERGDVLIFAASLPGGVGKYDLWYSVYVEGNWAEPSLLSSRINTPGNELFPNLSRDTIYFSSDYHTGYGGLDIFKTYQLEDGSWAPPENLKSPINSGYDEIGFVPDYAYANENKLDLAGYFSSNRPGGSGADDIYFFKQKRTKREVVIDDEPELKSRLQLNFRVKKKKFNIKDQPNSGVAELLNHSNSQLEVYVNNQLVDVKKSSLQGRIVVPIDTSAQYSFKFHADNFLSKSMDFNPRGKILPDREVTNIVETVVLDSIFTNVEIVLENIYYDFDKWDIRLDAEPTLDTLAMLLKDNPVLNIELSSHTDCRGGKEYNLELSQKRAEAAIQHLIKKGINPDRLIAVGYGDSRPAVDCECGDCTEEEHQQNRRTSFTILE